MASRRYCCVSQCNSYMSDSISIHNFPTQPFLRKQWQIALKIGKKISKYMSVCSLHFEEKDFHPDPLNIKRRRFLKKGVIPSKNLPIRTIEKKFPKKRKIRHPPKELYSVAACSEEPLLLSDTIYDEENPIEPSEDMFQNLKCLANVCEVQSKINPRSIGIQCEIGKLNEKPIETMLKYSEESFKNFTGININLFNALTACVQNVLDENEELHVNDVPTKILLCLIQLKLNLSFQTMSGMFLQHRTNLKKNFEVLLPLLRSAIDSAVYWPTIEENKNNMPLCFKKYGNTRVVLDCTEIPIQAPRCLKCRIRTYSYYKSTHTIKYLIGITPAGTISYVSEGFGGRTSDKAIFRASDIISELEQYFDAVMVDKGFQIEKETTEAGINLIRPPFLRSQAQLTKLQAEMTADIARARIHVERAIQRLKMFKISSERIPWTMMPFIDDAVIIIASITNLSNPLFKINTNDS